MLNHNNEFRATDWIILLVGSIAIGLFVGWINSRANGPKVAAVSKFDEVLYHINNVYVDSVNTKKYEEAAIVTLMDELDPHSQYISLEEFNAVNDPLLGGFEGIGVQFRIVNDTVTIVNTIKGGPSEKVGILAGDRIVRVNDSLIAGIKIQNDSVMRLLKGPKNTQVDVSICRHGVEGLLDFTITRDVIPTYSVDVAYMLNDSIGYLKLSKFSATTYKEFLSAIRKLKSQGMQRLIFDLRGNSGGYLSAAVEIADEFLHKGSLIVYTEGQSRPRTTFQARRKGILETMPVAVLIDGESASAAEIVAGALQDNDRGVIVGRRSFGKGLVQEQIMLSDQSAIRLTVARYYTPTGRCIQKPYDGDKEKYLYESYDRYQNGELFSVDSIHFADSLKFTTPKGKIVYGGGGIMPDVYVPLVDDSTEYFFNRMTNLGVLYQYAFDYCDSHRENLKRFTSAKEFDRTFQVTETMLNELIQRAEEKGIKGNEVEQQVAKKEAKILLKAYIARDLFDEEGFYPIYQPMDDILQRAIDEVNKITN